MAFGPALLVVTCCMDMDVHNCIHVCGSLDECVPAYQLTCYFCHFLPVGINFSFRKSVFMI